MPTKMLLVEDDPIVRFSAKRILEGYGLKVTEACCIEDAKESLARYQFSAVVSDISMPNGTGVELHEWVAEHCPYLLGKFFFCSGGMPFELEEYVNNSGCRLFKKPIDWNALIEALHEVRSPSSPKPAIADGA